MDILMQICEQNNIIMENKAPIYPQHKEHNIWKSNLLFYKEEINVFKKRLEELAQKNNASEVSLQIEHFQNQFIIQRNNIDELLHAINACETELETKIKKNPIAVDHRKVPFHSGEKEQIESFEINFNALRKEFYRFAAKWM
jgi:hypothetical protein